MNRPDVSVRLSYPMMPKDYLLGRDPECDIVLSPAGGISRKHAKLSWTRDHFEIADQHSRFGTTLNGLALLPNQSHALRDGDSLGLGDETFTYRGVSQPRDAAVPDFTQYAELLRNLASLEPWEVIRHGLEVIRRITQVERALLINTGRVPQLYDPEPRSDEPEPPGRTHRAPILTPLESPALQVSRSVIDEALRTKQAVSRTLGDTVTEPTPSIAELNLRRIWVYPVADPEGEPMAAIYLDSPTVGGRFTPEAEALLSAVAGHIATALRNAVLHHRYVNLVDELERRVRERTRDLEVSQAHLVSQDRLATLGRLVAAIAHELNNPVGAIASLAGTAQKNLEFVIGAQDELARLFEDAGLRDKARRMLDQVLSAAKEVPPDSRRRRELGDELAAWLQAAHVQAAETVAQRLARAGLREIQLKPFLEVLVSRGPALSALADQLYTFARSLETIGHSSHHVARIVDGLKTYAHLDRSESEIADIHRSISVALSVSAARVPKEVEVVTHFDNVPPFRHRPGEMMQVWTNLIDNAIQAMNEQGTLTVETHDEEDHVRVSVSDTGCGIPYELRDRLFDLEVTTRGPGAGLGLGLPICRTIVEKNHSGRIFFESQPGKTVFTVVLPKAGSEDE